jgi:hypothetical protein
MYKMENNGTYTDTRTVNEGTYTDNVSPTNNRSWNSTKKNRTYNDTVSSEPDGLLENVWFWIALIFIVLFCALLFFIIMNIPNKVTSFGRCR